MFGIENSATLRLNPSSLVTEENKEDTFSTIQKHVKNATYLFHFLDKHSQGSSQLGMILYDDLIKGLKKEAHYFNQEISLHLLAPKERLIASQMQKLLHAFLDNEGFENLFDLQKKILNDEIDESHFSDQFNQDVILLLPYLISNLKTISFLHLNFINSLLLIDEKDQNDLLFAEEKINHIISYFSTYSRAIVDLEIPEIRELLNAENIKDYLIDFYFEGEHFESLLNLLSNKGFTPEINDLKTHFDQMMVSINKLVNEQAQQDNVSDLTLGESIVDYQNFFRAIHLPFTG